MILLTRLEEAILIAVLRLEDEAYGVSINREVSKIFGRSYTLGALYFALDQLARKELLGKREGEPTPQRGGRSRTYYRVTPEGREGLTAVRRHQERLWEAAPAFFAGWSAR
jgi:DNA-binding PadR family transcriptional regulator